MRHETAFTGAHLEAFLTKHDLTNIEFAQILGITEPAVKHWLTGRREIPPTTTKLIKFFDSHPNSMKEFQIVSEERRT